MVLNCEEKNPKPPIFFFPVAFVSQIQNQIHFLASLPRLSHSFSPCKTKAFFPLRMYYGPISFVHNTGFCTVRGHELHIEFMLTQKGLFPHCSFTSLKSTFDHKILFDQLEQSLQRCVKLFTLCKILTLQRASVFSLLCNSIITSELSCWFIIY